MKKYLLTLFVVVTCHFIANAQVDYTANNNVDEYTGYYRPGINFGYYPGYSDIDLANVAAGNATLGINGLGAKTSRPALYDKFLEQWGWDIHPAVFEYYNSVDLKDLTCIIGFPSPEHREDSSYCSTGAQSQMFANLYTPVWDDGANGTPYNDDNYLAAYMYKLATLYQGKVKFWEIWNEPGFDHSFVQGWQAPGGPGNWWDNDPSPCVNHFKAPIQEFVRTLRICYDVIKTVDPDAYVTLAGVGFESFLDAVLRNTDNPDGGAVTADYPLGGGAYFDCMGFHTYPDIDGSVRHWDNEVGAFVYERHSDAAAKGVETRKTIYENRLAMYGYDNETYPRKEWIITELNSPRVKFNDNSMASNESQINYITKAVVYAMRLGIRQMHPFQIADRQKLADAANEFDLLGMYKNFTGTTPFEALEANDEGIAYKTTNDVINHTRYDAEKTAAMNLPEGVDGAAFYDEALQRFKYILWAKTTIDLSEAASATYSFPSDFGITTLSQRAWNYSMTYNATDVGPDDIALTARPIYLIEPSSIQSTLTAQCPDDITITGTAEEVVLTWDTPTATTTCGVNDLIIAQTQGPLMGTSYTWNISETITYQISDNCENTTSCSFQVTGILQEPEMTLTCPADINVTVAEGETGAEVSWNEEDVVITTNCGDPSVTQFAGPSNGSFFPIGETDIQYLGISTSCLGTTTLTETCSFNINVTDGSGSGSALSISCPEDITIVGTESVVTLNWEVPSATTTCTDPTLTITQTGGPVMGTSYNENTVQTITYQATDNCSNITTCSFTVTGQLYIAPEINITCPDDVKINVPVGTTGSSASWNEDDVVVTTNCGTASVLQVLGEPSGSFFPIGNSLIKYAGITQCNTASVSAVCQFNVTITEIVANNDVHNFAKFDLFPNPTSDVVTLDIEANQGDKISIEVYDNLGRMLSAKSHPFGSGHLKTTLSLGNLSNGIYLIKVKTPTQVGVKRVSIDR